LGTGKVQSITITSGSNMSKDDIDKAVKQAEEFAAEDKKRREEIDTRNGADQLIYQTEKSLSDIGDKITDEEKTDINGALEALKEAMKGTDIEAIKQKQEELQKKFYAISEKLYKAAAEAQQQQQGPTDAGNAPDSDPNVYEADYKDVDDSNK